MTKQFEFELCKFELLTSVISSGELLFVSVME